MDDAILDKIRKLHALAESPGNEAEAALAASRVQALLSKHNLELGEVVLKKDPGASVEAGRAWRRMPEHAHTLGRACNNMFDVLHYFRGGRSYGWRFVFIGLKANVESAVVTYEYLMESVEALGRGAKAQDLIFGIDEFMAFRSGAADRIREMARQQKAQALAVNPAYGEIVHIANALANDLMGAMKFKGFRGAAFGLGSIGTAAYSHGYEQGGRVDLAGARANRMLK